MMASARKPSTAGKNLGSGDVISSSPVETEVAGVELGGAEAMSLLFWRRRFRRVMEGSVVRYLALLTMRIVIHMKMMLPNAQYKLRR
jgi:hypothetical protein